MKVFFGWIDGMCDADLAGDFKLRIVQVDSDDCCISVDGRGYSPEAYDSTTQDRHAIFRTYSSSSHSMKAYSQWFGKGKLPEAEFIGGEKILPGAQT